MYLKHAVTVLGCVALLSGLSACSVESESWVNSNRLEIHNDQFTDTVPTEHMNEGLYHAIGEYYYRFGNGKLTALVSYDPNSKVNTKAKAEKAADKLRDGLAENGVRDAEVSIVASPATGDVSTTLITFPAITAMAPQDCGTMPGYQQPNDIQSNPSAKPDYRFGCTVETLLARQVSRPSDLLGKQGFNNNSDARRQERVLSTRGYYGDKPNAPLQGESATSGATK